MISVLFPYRSLADFPIRVHPSRRLPGDRLCHRDPISCQLNFKSIFIGRTHLKEGQFLTSLGNPFILGLPGTPTQPYLPSPQTAVLPGRVSLICRPPEERDQGRKWKGAAPKARPWFPAAGLPRQLRDLHQPISQGLVIPYFLLWIRKGVGSRPLQLGNCMNNNFRGQAGQAGLIS